MIVPVEIIPRSGWDARPPQQSTSVPWSKRAGVVIHHTTGDNLGRDNSADWVRAIQNYHMDIREWWDIGYNFLVDRAGQIYEGRGWTKLGAHVAGHNTANIGCVLLGDARERDNVTFAAKEALAWLVSEAGRRAKRELVVHGHGDLAATQCPGTFLAEWIADGLPVDDRDQDEPEQSTKLVLPAKPIIRPVRSRPVPGSRIAEETRLAQAALTYYHGMGALVGAIDGWPGPKTAGAVRELQRQRGATLVDGIPGPETWPMILDR